MSFNEKWGTRNPNDYDFYWLEVGTQVELEHTTDVDVAQEIAMDHLDESPLYYKELLKMEEKLSRLNTKLRRQTGDRAMVIDRAPRKTSTRQEGWCPR